MFSLIFISFNSAWFNVSFSSSENDTHAVMNDIVYIEYRSYHTYENCRRPGVAILDMQMSKVPIISGYVLLTDLLWLCCDWRCLYRCLLVYYDVVVTVALFISLLTGLLWCCCVCGVVFIAAYWSIVTGCCDCGVVYIAVYWFIMTLLWLWRCLYSYPEIEGTFLINIHHI